MREIPLSKPQLSCGSVPSEENDMSFVACHVQKVSGAEKGCTKSDEV